MSAGAIAAPDSKSAAVPVWTIKELGIDKDMVGLAGAQGDGAAFDPALSADGRVVAWESSATNLVPDDANETSDVFVRELGP